MNYRLSRLNQMSRAELLNAYQRKASKISKEHLASRITILRDELLNQLNRYGLMQAILDAQWQMRNELDSYYTQKSTASLAVVTQKERYFVDRYLGPHGPKS